MDLSKMSLDELTALEAEISGERARRAGEGLCVFEAASGFEQDPPAGGWLFFYEPAVESAWSTSWYATEEAARAALASLAKSEGRTLSGNHLDFTASGCHGSRAYIRVNKIAA